MSKSHSGSRADDVLDWRSKASTAQLNSSGSTEADQNLNWRSSDINQQKQDYNKFHYQDCHPLIFEADGELSFEDWEGRTPSKISVSKNKVSEIQVFLNEASADENKKFGDTLKNVNEKIWKGFDDLEQKKEVNINNMLSLAQSLDYTKGKWIIRAPWPETDKIWQLIIKGLIEGALPTSIIYIGIFAWEDPKINPHCNHRGKIEDMSAIKIRIRGENDYSKCMEVAKMVRSLGINLDMSYKPDIFTTCGLFAENQYGVKVSLWKLDSDGKEWNYQNEN